MITIIAAMSENFVIGKDNKLPWNLPEDLKRFKNLTNGYPIIMGRKTFHSLPKILPNRKHIVLSNNKKFNPPEEVSVYSSIHEILALPYKDMFVIGGGEIYNLFMNYADKIELTFVRGKYEGDTLFPYISPGIWQLDNIERHATHNFKTYSRRI